MLSGAWKNGRMEERKRERQRQNLPNPAGFFRLQTYHRTVDAPSKYRASVCICAMCKRLNLRAYVACNACHECMTVRCLIPELSKSNIFTGIAFNAAHTITHRIQCIRTRTKCSIKCNMKQHISPALESFQLPVDAKLLAPNHMHTHYFCDIDECANTANTNNHAFNGNFIGSYGIFRKNSELGLFGVFCLVSAWIYDTRFCLGLADVLCFSNGPHTDPLSVRALCGLRDPLRLPFNCRRTVYVVSNHI